MTHVGGELRRLREQAGVTQSDLAQVMGLSQSSIVRAEQNESPPVLKMVAYETGLGIPPGTALRNLGLLDDAV